MKPSEFIKEEFDSAEYNDETGMVKNDIHTIVRVMTHLCRELKDDENLPEWVQGKISTAKGMLVNVMDYMISQHEQGIQPTVSEDATGMGTNAIATVSGVGTGNKVGSLFGGTYKQPKTKKRTTK